DAGRVAVDGLGPRADVPRDVGRQRRCFTEPLDERTDARVERDDRLQRVVSLRQLPRATVATGEIEDVRGGFGQAFGVLEARQLFGNGLHLAGLQIGALD